MLRQEDGKLDIQTSLDNMMKACLKIKRNGWAVAQR